MSRRGQQKRAAICNRCSRCNMMAEALRPACGTYSRSQTEYGRHYMSTFMWITDRLKCRCRAALTRDEPLQLAVAKMIEQVWYRNKLMIERLAPAHWRRQVLADTRNLGAYPGITEYFADACAAARELEPITCRGPLPRGAVVLAAVIRNEVRRLPGFLAHYRSLGVDRFLV